MIELVVGNQWTEVRRISIRLSQILEDRLRYLSPSASEYNDAYASGRWDGFIKLYDRMRSRFPTGLLQMVKRIFTELGVEYTVTTNLPDLPPQVERIYKPKFSLRPYQEEAVEKAIKWRRGVIHIPTGGGKTEVAQAIIDRAKINRLVFLVPSTAILRQTVRRMREAFPQATIIQWGDGEKPPEAGAVDDYILVATIQSAFKTAHPLLRYAKGVFIDESHHQSATTFQEAVRHCRDARYLWGLSATPYRHDNTDMELEAWVGPIIYSVSYEHLINNGWLVPPNFRTVSTLVDGLELSRNTRTFVFAEKEADLTASRSTFDKYGAVILTSKSGKKTIERTLDAFREGEVTHIACTPIFDEGLDVPDIETVFFYSTCGARTRAMQRIGRAMRPGTKLDGTNKTCCTVIDLLDAKYHDRMLAYIKEPAFAARM